MDLTNVALGLSEVSEMRFEDTLLKRINQDYYYVLDFVRRESIWSCEVRKMTSRKEDVPYRIRLYDQPSASKFGVSFSVGSFIGKARVMKMITTITELGIPVEGLIDWLESDRSVYPETDEEMVEMWGDVIRAKTGYMTIAIDGRYVVDEGSYDAYMVDALYSGMRVVKEEKRRRKGNTACDEGVVCRCYVCGSSDDLIHGGTKEPAWKFISTTRTSGLADDGIANVRCMDCERKLMRGFYEMQALVKYEYTKTQAFERLVIPLTRDVKLWRQLKRLRTELPSDMRYYEALEGLLDRFERRGVSEVLYARILKNQRSYAVLSAEVIEVSDMRHLRKREEFKRSLRDAGWLSDTDELGYFPEVLLASDSPYRWKYVDRIKRYWMGLEKDDVFREVENTLRIPVGTFGVYRLWSVFVEKGNEGMRDDVLSSRRYLLGRLMGVAIRVQERERAYPSFLGYTGKTSIERRFNGYPRDEERAFDSCVEVIEYRRKYLNEDEWTSFLEMKRLYRIATSGGSDYYYELGKKRSERDLML